MHRFALLITLLVIPVARAAETTAPTSQPSAMALYQRVSPSMVAVQYVWESELGRQELTGTGVVVRDDGLVMTSLSIFDIVARQGQFRIPDKQMKEFKILVPSQEHEPEEIDATFEGRDERTGTGFVKAKKTPASGKWQALKFTDSRVDVGDAITSVGMLSKNAAYKTYYTQGHISATLRGELPQYLVVGGNLAAVGAPVFNAAGEAVGVVNTQPEQTPFLHNPQNALAPLVSPPIFFVPTWDFLQSLNDPPVAGKELKLPWLGVPQQAMAGLNKDVAESMGLKDQPAVEVGDIIPGSPLDKAGIKPGNIILKVNGKTLERPDESGELPGILARQIRRMKVGDTVTLTVLTGKGAEPKEVKLPLEERPKGENLAERIYDEDLGFGVRELVFFDAYVRRLPQETKGVVVSIIKPQSSANAAKLQRNDLITEINGEKVADLADFKKRFENFRKEKPREAIVLVALRDGTTQTIRIEPPQ
jgi:serine protease Do